MNVNGLYKINAKYFVDFPSEHWMENKSGRPHYFCIADTDGIIWMIPLSTQTANYKEKIKREELKRGAGNCIYYHVGIISGKERVFLISDMFPVTGDYIIGAYVISGTPYIVKDKKIISSVHSKAMRYLKLIESGVMRNRNAIMEIKQKLTKNSDSQKNM